MASKKIPMPSVIAEWAQRQGFDCDDINSRIDNGMSPLMLAAKDGELEILRLLLSGGADVDLINDDENTALWFACFSDEPMMVNELIQAGCNLDNQNVNGATCLIYCASTGKFDLVRLLVQAGADVSRQTLDGFTALDSATTLPILKFLRPASAQA
jgi:thiosulfate/3-mercaptopyruvate sulfurtransferase